MPPVNHAVLASVGIVAASVAVAAAIAIYEIPEVRRAAEDLRRRIAIALHALGDNVDPNNPNSREPRFNRPEDAEGFYQSHDVDADEETRRRQREELMYWNMRREAEKQRQSPDIQQRSRGSTFDDFLQPDRAGESGTYVYNTGANAWDTEGSNVLRRRGNVEPVRGLNAAVLANPFSDEYGIELEDRADPVPPTPEAMSDIYNATPLVRSPLAAASPAQPVPVPAASEVLFDFASHAPSEYGTAASSSDDHHANANPQQQQQPSTPTSTTARSATLDRELADDEYMTAGQDDRHAADAYASIQAWAQHSSHAHNAGFYSPLPSTPRAPVSEPEVISEHEYGRLTPADSASVAGSGVDVANETASNFDEDVLSESEGGIPTPGSWSEVGSVVSESESLARA
jgi:hypothetical protein